MSLQQLILILLARRRIVFYMLLGTVVLVLLLSAILPAKYTAATDVLVDVKSPDPVAGMVLPALVAPGYMATQLDIINSDRVAWRVVKLLHLDENPAIKEQWQDSTGERGTIEVWLGALLQKGLIVKPSRESNVITISYKSPDPKFAAAIANAFAQAYIDTNIELQVEPARQYAKWFEAQGKTAREALTGARAKLSDYQQKTGIVAVDQRLDAETAKLNDISTQLTQVQSLTVDAQSKEKSAAGDTLPEVMQSPLIQGLKSSIAQLESKLQDMAGNLGSNHPQIKRSEAELASLKQQLAAETKKITDAVSTSGRISRGKEVELRAAIEAQKQKILELNNQRNEVMVLQQEADNAQKAYDAIAARLTQTSMESKSVQSNISVLTPAVEPLDPSFPKYILNTILAIIVGTVLGVGAALVKEIVDRRVRLVADVEVALELPLLVKMAAPLAKTRGSRWHRILARLPIGRQKSLAIPS